MNPAPVTVDPLTKIVTSPASAITFPARITVSSGGLGITGNSVVTGNLEVDAFTCDTINAVTIAMGSTVELNGDEALLQTNTLTGITNKTFVAPVLGAATATSVAIGGATIGSHGLAVTGTSAFSSTLTISGGSGLQCAANVVSTAGHLVAAPSAGHVLIGGTAAGASATSQRMQKKTTAIADATPTTVLTITIPNGAHSASVRVRVCGSLGAGGAVGANEASQTISYDIGVTRVAGVASVAVISTAYGSSGSVAVAGATTIAVTAAVAADAGNTTTNSNSWHVQATITKGGGSSANHTCLVSAECHNSNSSGATIA